MRKRLKSLPAAFFAKVGVEGSNPFARSKNEMSDPETWVTERT